jgi:hypothetical protein
MLDLLLGGALRVHYHLSYTREDSRILSGIAKAEGIDIDQFRRSGKAGRRHTRQTPYPEPEKETVTVCGMAIPNTKESAGAA